MCPGWAEWASVAPALHVPAGHRVAELGGRVCPRVHTPRAGPCSSSHLLPPWHSCRLGKEGRGGPASTLLVQLLETPWTAAHQDSLSITNSWSPPKPMSIVSVMPSSHLILSCPLFLLPSIFPSIRGFSNELAVCIRLPKYWMPGESHGQRSLVGYSPWSCKESDILLYSQVSCESKGNSLEGN